MHVSETLRWLAKAVELTKGHKLNDCAMLKPAETATSMHRLLIDAMISKHAAIRDVAVRLRAVGD